MYYEHAGQRRSAMVALRLIRVLAVTAGSVGGLSGATYGLLSEQSRRARAVIGTPLGLPWVRLAAGLAEETAAPVRLTTHAMCGATTRQLPAQVDAALLDPPGI